MSDGVMLVEGAYGAGADGSHHVGNDVDTVGRGRFQMGPNVKDPIDYSLNFFF